MNSRKPSPRKGLAAHPTPEPLAGHLAYWCSGNGSSRLSTAATDPTIRACTTGGLWLQTRTTMTCALPCARCACAACGTACSRTMSCPHHPAAPGEGFHPTTLAAMSTCAMRAASPGDRAVALANGRCVRHGGMSTGPKTPEGKRRSALNLALARAALAAKRRAG